MGLCHSSRRMKDKSMWEKVIYLRYYSKQQDNKLNIMLFRFEIMAAARCLGVCAGGDPDQLWGALPCDVTTWGVPLDDAEDQTHGWAVGQRHPLTGCQTEPCQASEEEGEHIIHNTSQCIGYRESKWDSLSVRQGSSTCCIRVAFCWHFGGKICCTSQITAHLFMFSPLCVVLLILGCTRALLKTN